MAKYRVKPISPTHAQQVVPVDDQDGDRVSYRSGHKSRSVSRRGSASSNNSKKGGLRKHDFESAAQRAKMAYEQAIVYEKKIENRVTYLQKEEKKYVMKILATRSKASKI